MNTQLIDSNILKNYNNAKNQSKSTEINMMNMIEKGYEQEKNNVELAITPLNV
jgi:hypothetical protein